jgi:hypothetical protein
MENPSGSRRHTLSVRPVRVAWAPSVGEADLPLRVVAAVPGPQHSRPTRGPPVRTARYSTWSPSSNGHCSCVRHRRSARNADRRRHAGTDHLVDLDDVHPREFARLVPTPGAVLACEPREGPRSVPGHRQRFDALPQPAAFPTPAGRTSGGDTRGHRRRDTATEDEWSGRCRPARPGRVRRPPGAHTVHRPAGTGPSGRRRARRRPPTAPAPRLSPVTTPASRPPCRRR